MSADEFAELSARDAALESELNEERARLAEAKQRRDSALTGAPAPPTSSPGTPSPKLEVTAHPPLVVVGAARPVAARHRWTSNSVTFDRKMPLSMELKGVAERDANGQVSHHWIVVTGFTPDPEVDEPLPPIHLIHPLSYPFFLEWRPWACRGEWHREERRPSGWSEPRQCALVDIQSIRANRL